MKKLKLPIIKVPVARAKILSMDDYLKVEKDAHCRCAVQVEMICCKLQAAGYNLQASCRMECSLRLVA